MEWRLESEKEWGSEEYMTGSIGLPKVLKTHMDQTRVTPGPMDNLLQDWPHIPASHSQQGVSACPGEWDQSPGWPWAMHSESPIPLTQKERTRTGAEQGAGRRKGRVRGATRTAGTG